jgi:hypothetical protein
MFFITIFFVASSRIHMKSAFFWIEPTVRGSEIGEGGVWVGGVWVVSGGAPLRYGDSSSAINAPHEVHIKNISSTFVWQAYAGRDFLRRKFA